MKRSVIEAKGARAYDAAHSEIHDHGQFHHHHSHGPATHHGGGHHLLQIEHLSIGFSLYDPDAGYWSAEQRMTDVIDDLALSVHEGEMVALVGASGSGKTLLADAIMGLYAENAHVRGTIYFDGQLQSAESLARLRGREVAFVPQGVDALDPLMKVGRQIGASREERLAIYERYGLDPSVDERYPFELSGGMARRVLLATALVSSPRLIVADEPTPGLDLELAVRAMDDFRDFVDRGGSALVITHDIELALRVADRIAVFKDGTIVEETSVESFASPELLQHPFSRALWHALPEHGFTVAAEESEGAAPAERQDGSGTACAAADGREGGAR